MRPNPKILIIQTAFLGDTILSLPMVQTLKKISPDSIIDYLCIPSTSNILTNSPYINKVIIYDKKARHKLSKLRQIVKKVRSENYDIVLCPHRSFRSALITYRTKASVRIGFDKNSLSFLLTHKATYRIDCHEIIRNLELIKQIPELNISTSDFILKPEFFPSEEDVKIADNILGGFILRRNFKTIIFAPCSKWFTKKIPEAKAVEIVDNLCTLQNKVILIGGIDDKDFCESILKHSKFPTQVSNLAGKLSPVQSSIVIQKTDALITVDSAAAHIGATTDTPIVMIYGSTVPAFGFYPLTSQNVIIENSLINCRPCTNHGRGSCPRKHFKCMNDLDTDEIIKAVN